MFPSTGVMIDHLSTRLRYVDLSISSSPAIATPPPRLSPSARSHPVQSGLTILAQTGRSAISSPPLSTKPLARSTAVCFPPHTRLIDTHLAAPHAPDTRVIYLFLAPLRIPTRLLARLPDVLAVAEQRPLSLAVPLGLTLPAPSPPSPLELAGASSYLPPLDFSDLFSPTLLLGSEKDKMSPASARSQAQTGIATGTVPATGSGSSHPSHSFPSHGTLGSEYQSATQAQGQVSQERSTASPGSVQPQNGSGNATANATQAPVSASEWSAKSSQATNLQVQVHLQLPSQLPGLLPQLPESVVQPARPFQTSPKPQTSQRSEVLQSEPAHAPQLPISHQLSNHTPSPVFPCRALASVSSLP
ncbi:hypothetical protein EHS25_007073 [Saitozyma podzolica]|uniref:Uncharacterized protein n=1 Tax=Saitozyma podzolica TaxID=1890683 RepID=A0A427XPH6_9TREE|nr:hypothetical protein EHS25_007073 [Saitozyma podzolica]